MATLSGLEPLTYGLTVHRSNQLSYRVKNKVRYTACFFLILYTIPPSKGQDGIRTRVLQFT